MCSRTDVAAVLTAAILIASPVWAQTTSALSARAAAASPLPAEVAAPLKALLGSDGVTVIRGGTTIELWWVKALPLTASASDWSGVAEGELVGAMRVAGPFREIRGKTIKAGAYTLRYGRQPQNGDHLGASPFREFLLMSPAELDTDPKPLGFEGTNAISKQAIGTSHPAALSIDPPVATAALLSLHKSELDHEAVIVEVPTGAGKPLRFGLILVGVITP